MLDLWLRLAVESDSQFLGRLYASTREKELTYLPWSITQKHTFLNSQFFAREAYYQANYPQAEDSIICYENHTIGRLYVNQGDLEIRIIDFSLVAEYRNRGMGLSLMLDLQRQAVEAGKKLAGSIDRTNRAITFWKRLGFKITEGDELYLPMVWDPHQKH